MMMKKQVGLYSQEDTVQTVFLSRSQKLYAGMLLLDNKYSIKNVIHKTMKYKSS